MRIALTLLCCILIETAAFSQFGKGRILAGGSVSFSATTDKSKIGAVTSTNSHSTDISFSPQAGYFIIDNLAVGAGLSLGGGSTKYEGTPDFKISSSSLSIVPFVRYYLQPGIFFQGLFGVGTRTSKSTSGGTSTETKYGRTQLGLGAGYAYFLNDFVAVEPFVGYQSSAETNKSNDNKSIDSGIHVNVGLQVYLGPRK